MSEPELIIKRVKKYAAPEDGGSSAWKIALADFMTGLMILFFVLWAVGNKSAEEKEALTDYFSGKEITEDAGLLRLEETYNDINELLNEKGVVVSLDKSTRSITVQFDSEMLFISGSSTLKNEAKDVIGSFVKSVKGREFFWHVYGYTDDVPVRRKSLIKSNLELSLNRSASAAFVIMDNGISDNHITIHGEGQLNPIESNASKDGKQSNRRVEIYMTESSAPSKVYKKNVAFTEYEGSQIQKTKDIEAKALKELKAGKLNTGKVNADNGTDFIVGGNKEK